MGTNGFHDPFLGHLESQLEAFRQSDIQRNSLVQDVVRKYTELQQQYENKCSDYENELASRRMWQAQARRSDLTLSATTLSLDTNGFILALIDGDGAIFHDHLYKAGIDGGAEAAHELYEKIREHVAQCHPDKNTSSYTIMVQIFYNMEGLSHKLRSLGILKNPNEMAPFARAFSLNKSLFSFIDVGSGKERADHKLRETLRLFLPNMQCKHVIVGGTFDNGYLTTLDQYKRDPALAPRISLLETLPMQPGFTQLGFKTIQFPTVFRSEPLPDKATPASPVMQHAAATQSNPALTMRNNSFAAGGVSVAPTPASTQPATNLPKRNSPTPSTDSTTASWASVGKSAGPKASRTINISTKKAGKAQKPRFIILNAYDERLDPELPKPDPAAQQRLFDRIRKNKVCNGFHLTGKCEAGEYCDYDHGERLSPGEQLALRHRAITRSCNDRGACRDFDCTNGHVCPYGKDCYGDKCWFEDVHDIDPEPVSRIFENGEKEWLKKFT